MFLRYFRNDYSNDAQGADGVFHRLAVSHDRLQVMDGLVSIIRSWSVRARWQGSLYWVFFGLFLGLSGALILAIVARVFPILDTMAIVALSAICTTFGIVMAIAWPWIRASRQSPVKWARQFDREFQLKERLSTALELREGVVSIKNEQMRSIQNDDALATAGEVNIRHRLPFRIQPRFVVASLVIALVLAFTLALPNPQQQVLANRAQMQQVEQAQLQQIEETKQQVQQSTALTNEQKKQIAQALDDAEKALSSPNSAPEQALAAINDAQSRLDSARDQTFQDQRDSLQRAGQALAPDPLTNSLANALESGNFQKAAEQMKNLAQNNGKPLTSEERQRIADQLEQMARNVQNTNQLTAQQLRAAAQNLREKQDQAAQTALNQVAQTLNQAAQKQVADKQLSQTQSGIEDARRAISESARNSKSAQAQQSQNDAASKSRQNSSGNQQGADSQNTGAGSQDQPSSNADAHGSSSASDQTNSDAQRNTGGLGDNVHHEDTGTDDSVMVADRVNDPGQNVVLPDDNGQSVANPNANANPGLSNQSSVPYQQVYSRYAKTADDAIQSGSVPPNLRDYVRDYFSSLNPRQTR